ncbi:MAG: tetraacyldisaccharide 4'-kinase [Chloroflexi bacterium]|nr:tetraacyldisaccharide 4'-kinase [Chloroflexota bacterium]
MTGPVRTIILGAAGRDFHNFNVVYREDPATRVVAFTAAQIPGIAHRRYPASLAGSLYPEGIVIEDERDLEAICRREKVERAVFAYSDVGHEEVMHLASRVLAAGADFELLGPDRTMLRAQVPVIAVTAARTGSGKSPLSRWLARKLRDRGIRVAVVRHPMPYGDLEEQRVQRFATVADLDASDCTAEEREEYEPHIAAGAVVWAGVDYADVLEAAQQEASIIVWDGGNNDFPFFRPDLLIAVADALRPGQANRYHPGETVLRMASVVVVTKVDAAAPGDVAAVEAEVRALNPRAPLAHASLPVSLDDPGAVSGRRVLVVEDGPTTTHGGMAFGAGYVAARAAGASEIVDPRESAAGTVRALFAKYPHIGPVLPAAGYSDEEVASLRDTINASRAEVVVAGSPIDLAALTGVAKPVVRARYGFEERSEPLLARCVDDFIARHFPASG